MLSWEWAIKDKVQISSNSYGSPGGKHEMKQQQLNCALAGVTVVVANGNEGSPGPCTIPQGDVAASNSVIGVGATDDLDSSSLQIFSCPDKSFEKTRINGYWGDPSHVIATANIPYEIVDCDYGTKSDFKSKDVKNKLVLVSLGPSNNGKNTIDGDEKVANAKAAGAKAVIMYNNNYGIMEESYESSKDSIPVFNITVSDGFAIRDQIYYGIQTNEDGSTSKQNQVTACFSAYSYKGAMADFSSNGPTAKGFLKPDVSAPGVGIHAAVAKTIKSYIKDDYFDDFGGTSAACPIVAGCAALMRQGRPEWSPFEIKRALMNTSTMLRRSDGLYYYPLTVQGMGRVDVEKAITTQTLIQPPSALLMTDGTGTRIADPPEEWKTPELRNKIPDDVVKMTIPLKLYNYSNKPQTYSVSYEINSSDPSLLDVRFSSKEVTIPAAGSETGIAWLGLDIKTNGLLTNRFNDVIVWLANNETGEKIHMGVCVYNNDYVQGGLYNQFLCNLKTDKPSFSPNGDGTDEKVEISYEVTNGSLTFDYTLPCFKNIGEALCFWIDDENSDHWACIKVIDFFDLGPGKFTWDGKDIYGRYVLPDGNWNIGISVKCQYLSNNKIKTGYLGYRNLGYKGVTGSNVSPPSTLSTYVLPIEPGVGKEFQVGLYLSKVENVQEISFDIDIPGASILLSYAGFKQGDLITEDEGKSFFEVEYNKETEQIHVDITKEGSRISGSGWLLYLNFVALEANYIDLHISNFKLAVPGSNGKFITKKGFTRNAEIQIMKQAYNPSDFNKDGAVDDKDLQIILKSMRSQDGEPGYNWRCDLNYDRTITIDDLAIFTKSIGN